MLILLITVDGLIINYFAPAKLIIEVDGSYHDTINQRKADLYRMILHSKMGYHSLRITNKEIEEDFAGIVQWIIGVGSFLKNVEKNMNKASELIKFNIFH